MIKIRTDIEPAAEMAKNQSNELKMEGLNIKELIHAVRQELMDSEQERIRKGIPPLFVVDNLKIEVNFVVEKKTTTGGGLNLKIVDVGRDVSYNSQQIHKITLELKTCAASNDFDEPDSVRMDIFPLEPGRRRNRFPDGSSPIIVPPDLSVE